MTKCWYLHRWYGPCKNEALPDNIFCLDHISHLEKDEVIDHYITRRFYISSNGRLNFHKFGNLAEWFKRESFQLIADYLI